MFCEPSKDLLVSWFCFVFLVSHFYRKSNYMYKHATDKRENDNQSTHNTRRKMKNKQHMDRHNSMQRLCVFSVSATGLESHTATSNMRDLLQTTFREVEKHVILMKLHNVSEQVGIILKWISYSIRIYNERFS